MAEILLDISFGTANEPPMVHAAWFRQLTESLCQWNCTMLPRWHLPPLYRSGVKYRVEKVQRLPDAYAIYKRRAADCGPLAAWRAAECRLAGDPAQVRIYWRPISGGRRLFHAQIRHGSRCPRCLAVQQTGCPPEDRTGRRPTFAQCVRCREICVPWGVIEDPSRLLSMPTHG